MTGSVVASRRYASLMVWQFCCWWLLREAHTDGQAVTGEVRLLVENTSVVLMYTSRRTDQSTLVKTIYVDCVLFYLVK